MATNKQAFINSIMPAAIQYGQQIGVDPRIIVAQAAHESAWGRSAPGNNYFGIKSHGQGGGQNLTTHEVINGQRVKINDSFRTFNSPSDSVAGYADFLTSNKRYQPMLAAQGLDAQIEALGNSGYATDPNYAERIRSIAKSIPIGSQIASQEAAPPQASGTPAPAMGEPITIGSSSVPGLMAPQTTQAQPTIAGGVSDIQNGNYLQGVDQVLGSMSGGSGGSQIPQAPLMQLTPSYGSNASNALGNYIAALLGKKDLTQNG